MFFERKKSQLLNNNIFYRKILLSANTKQHCHNEYSEEHVKKVGH